MEAIACDRMRPETGPPEAAIWKIQSWNSEEVEFSEFVDSYWLNGLSAAGLRESAVLRIIKQIYEGTRI
jgi:hypothetical protein